MRLTIICKAILALTCVIAVASPAWAEPVKLHITAQGISIDRADQISFLVPVVTRGTTASAARAANEKRVDEITASLVAKGIDHSQIKRVFAQSRTGFVGNELPEYDHDGTGIDPALKLAGSNLRVTFADPDLTPRIRQAIEDVIDGYDGSARFALQDDRAARQAAIANALVNARKEADYYALASGMKVAGILAVSNVGELKSGMYDQDALMQLLGDQQDSVPNTVTTRANVTVDFELSPR